MHKDAGGFYMTLAKQSLIRMEYEIWTTRLVKKLGEMPAIRLVYAMPACNISPNADNSIVLDGKIKVTTSPPLNLPSQLAGKL